MELRNFVKATLIEIIRGVEESQKEAKGHKAAVIPRKETPEGSKTGFQYIEFDVEVSTSKGKGKTGGAGVVVGPIAIGGRGDSTKAATSVARIKFGVPIRFPFQDGDD